MDKAYEQIKYLKAAINLKTIEYENQKKAKKALETEKNKLELKNKGLEGIKNQYESDKENYLYKQKNIKKWKKQTIIATMTLIILTEIIIFWVTALFKEPLDIIYTLLMNVIGIPSSLLFGERGNYYTNKKYLNKVNLDDIENAIKEIEEKISLNKEMQGVINTDLQVIEQQLPVLFYEIDEMKLAVNTLNAIRNRVINNYIENNKELDTLINNDFNEYYEEKNKVFTKKK